jgi:uncharacterized protein involved in exopolysaccharide biosynthesis
MHSRYHEEIDVRSVLVFMLQRWYVLFITAGAFAGGIALFQYLTYTEKFTAATWVIVDPLAYSVAPNAQFVPYFNQPPLPVDALEPLALSDRVLSETLVRLESEINGDALASLRRSLDIVNSGENGLSFELTAQSETATEAAQIVNAWAYVFSTEANHLFSSENSARLQQLRNQRDVILSEIDDLRAELDADGITDAERITLELEIEAKLEIYRSLVAALSLAESGLDNYFELRVTSYAANPHEPDDPNTVMLTILGAISGIAIGTAILLIWSLVGQAPIRHDHDGVRQGDHDSTDNEGEAGAAV